MTAALEKFLLDKVVSSPFGAEELIADARLEASPKTRALDRYSRARAAARTTDTFEGYGTPFGVLAGLAAAIWFSR